MAVTRQENALKRIALVLFCLCISSVAAAETMYIGDNLRVGVRPEPGTASAPVKVITSGSVIKILQKSPNYLKIRTEDGVEGWIRDDYVSETPPARSRLQEIEKELGQKQLEQQKMRQELAASNQRSQVLQQQVDLLNGEIQNLHQKIASLRPDNSKAWLYIIIATLSLCGLTFILGILWNKQQVAKKLGGHSL